MFLSATGTGSLLADNSRLTYTLVPGLTTTLIIPAGASYRVLLQTDGGVQLNSADPAAIGFTDVAMFVDGAQIGSGRRVPVINNTSVQYSVGLYGFSVETTLGAGVHTIEVRAKKFSTTFTDSYISSAASGSVLPGNPRLQGILIVVAFP